MPLKGRRLAMAAVTGGPGRLAGDQAAPQRRVVGLLQAGAPIAMAAEQAGYFDHPHLSRSLRRFTGHTPAQLLDGERADQLSFLYKTEPFARP